MKKRHVIPEGWSEEEIKDLADHYDNQPEDEAIAEMETAQRLVPLDYPLYNELVRAAREKKVTVEKLLKSIIRKGISKAV